jgi:tetraacyldisaccharide 4'-kinase
MRQPEFWKAEVSGRDTAVMLKALLTPLSWIYAYAAEQRIKTTTPRHAGVPVICVGNLTVGGAGKTPITRALRAKLPGAHSLSRGYGGKVEGPLRVTPEMDAGEVGDEPLLHARDGPAWIAHDRVAGARAALSAGARAIIMDDGFQNPALAKDLSIVAVDAGFGVGNRAVFPAGPLRERLANGLSRAHALVFLRSAGDAVPEVAPDWHSDFKGPVLQARLEPSAPLPQGPLIAFAGIARPEKFFTSLTTLGAKLEDGFSFPDHHVFAEDDLMQLARVAGDRGARLITTEKDAVRLSPAWRERVLTLPVTAKFEDEAALDALLAPILSRMNAGHG